MKRVLLLFSFLALMLAGVVSADRVAGACCPAGEAGAAIQAHGHHQMQADGHKAAGCCEKKAHGAAGKAGCCEKHADANGACCEKHAEGASGACCEKQADGERGGGCEQKVENGTKAGCCAKKAGSESKGGCCSKGEKAGARS